MAQEEKGARLAYLRAKNAEVVARIAATHLAAPVPPDSADRPLRPVRSADSQRKQLEQQRRVVLGRLAKLQAMRKSVDSDTSQCIARALELGLSKVDIAASLGITRQAVQQRAKSLDEKN